MVKKIFITLILILTIFSFKDVKAVLYGEYMETYMIGVKYTPIGKFTLDSTNDEFYSQKYMVSKDRLEILKYNILSLEGFPEGSYIQNAVTGEKQTEFKTNELTFKVMVPKEKAEKDFIGKIKVKLSFKAANVYYTPDDKLLMDYVYDENEQTIVLDNRSSEINIKVSDLETYEGIEGVKMELEDAFNIKTEKNTAGNAGYVYLNKVSEGQMNIKVLEVPNDYVLDKLQYTVEIGRKKNEFYEIKLKHKKGKVHLVDNAKKATFQIYDSDINLIGVYETNEDGEIEIEELNTGKYLLIQKDVDDAYYRAENEYFTIEENQTCEINITNIEKPKTEIKDTEDTENSEETIPKDENDESKDTEQEKDSDTEQKTEPQGNGQVTPNQNESEKQEENNEQDNQKNEGQKVPEESNQKDEEQKVPEESNQKGEEQKKQEENNQGDKEQKLPEEDKKQEESKEEQQEDEIAEEQPKNDTIGEITEKGDQESNNDDEKEDKIEDKRPELEDTEDKNLESETEEPETEESEVKEAETKEPEIKEPETKDPEQSGANQVEEEPSKSKEIESEQSSNNEKLEYKGEEKNEEGLKEVEENSEYKKQVFPSQDKNEQKTSNITVLPRTGEDYLEIKLIVISLIICIAYILYSSKKQTAKKQPVLSKDFKE